MSVITSQVLKQHLLVSAKYNKWAHAQIGSFCTHHFQNNPEFYTRNVSIPFGSIRNTLAHLWLSEQIWYCRMIGGTHRNLKLSHTVPRSMDMQEFATYWTENHPNEGQWERFFDGIDNELLFQALSKSADNWIELVQVQTNDEELCQEFTYFDTSNKKCVYHQNVIVMHVINHSTHHRGQISAAVTQLLPDVQPILLDLPAWLKQSTNTGYSTNQ
eukprot:308808_1